jgi:hypothetical protein
MWRRTGYREDGLTMAVVSLLLGLFASQAAAVLRRLHRSEGDRVSRSHHVADAVVMAGLCATTMVGLRGADIETGDRWWSLAMRGVQVAVLLRFVVRVLLLRPMRARPRRRSGAAGTLSDADAMRHVIEEECESIDADTW